MSLAFTFTPVADEHMRRQCLSARDMLGNIPDWLSAADTAGVVEQIDLAYGPIGGGWRDTRGHVLDVERGLLTYPGDPARPLIAQATLRDECILFLTVPGSRSCSLTAPRAWRG